MASVGCGPLPAAVYSSGVRRAIPPVMQAKMGGKEEQEADPPGVPRWLRQARGDPGEGDETSGERAGDS